MTAVSPLPRSDLPEDDRQEAESQDPQGGGAEARRGKGRKKKKKATDGTAGPSAQDVPREALEPRAIAEAPPVPVKAPRKTLKQIQQGKEEAHRLLMEAVELEQKDCGAVINLVNADQKVQAQRVVELYKRAIAILREVGGDKEDLAKALYSLGTASILASATRLEAMPYMEEAVAIFEDPKNGLTSRSVRNVMYMCSARSMLLTSYHKLGRYDDAAAIAKGIMQACQGQQLQGKDRALHKDRVRNQIDALRGLATWSLLRGDYAGVRDYCGQGMGLIEAEARQRTLEKIYVDLRLMFLVLLGGAAEKEGDDDSAASYDQQVEQVMKENETPDVMYDSGNIRDLLILPTFRRRLNRLVTEYEHVHNRREALQPMIEATLDRVVDNYRQLDSRLSQDDREPIMECVKTLRHGIRYLRFIEHHKSADHLEAKLNETEAHYIKVEADLLEQLRRNKAAATASMPAKASKCGKKKSQKRRSKAKQKAEEQAAEAALARLQLEDIPPQEGANSTAPDSLPSTAENGEKVERGQNGGQGEEAPFEEEEEDEECAVCLNGIAEGGGPGPAILCGHVFHGQCLEDWVHMCKSKGHHVTCPYCRQPLFMV